MCIKSPRKGPAMRRRTVTPPWLSWNRSFRTGRENSWTRSPIWRTGSGRTRSAPTSFPQPTLGCVRHYATKRQELKLESMRSNDRLMPLCSIKPP
jgi:hypothetical protein